MRENQPFVFGKCFCIEAHAEDFDGGGAVCSVQCVLYSIHCALLSVQCVFQGRQRNLHLVS